MLRTDPTHRWPSWVFAALSSMAFVTPYVSSWGQFPPQDLLLAGAWFAVVLCSQLLVLLRITRLWRAAIPMHVVRLALLCANLVFFVHVLTADSRLMLAGVLSLYAMLYLLASQSNKGSKVLALFACVHVASWSYLLVTTNHRPSPTFTDLSQTSPTSTKPASAQRSVYVIGIDGMVSRAAYRSLFDSNESPAYQWLEKYGFALYDRRSPGDQTLTTFGALLRGTSDVHPRTVRKLFNGGQQSPLYEKLSARGFQRQFFFKDDYFGTDAGRIESFKPTSSTFSFCDYTDDRWGFYFCRILKSTRPKSEGISSAEAHFRYFDENVQVDRAQRWFSIHHIWFPGHTLGAYSGSRTEDRAAFRKYYIDAQLELRILLQRITERIRREDPQAAIVFFGDHGAYLLRGAIVGQTLDESMQAVTPTLLELDARSVLLAVHPMNLCRKELESVTSMEQLLLNLADCASH